MDDNQLNNGEQLNENVKKPIEAHNLDAKKDGIGLFLGSDDVRYLNKLAREISEEQVRESFLLYRIDLKTTKTHALYGEAMFKNYLPAVEIYGLIDVESDGPEYLAPGGLIRYGMGKINAGVLLSTLEEANVEIRMGDYIYHKGNYYEIIDDGKANLSNEYAYGGDKFFYINIKGVEVNGDVFKAR